MDLAASIQVVTDEIVLRMARHVGRTTGMKKLVMAGGVALNCVANGRIVREGIFDRIWIQPAAGDAGGALGAALFVWHQLFDHERTADGVNDAQHGSLLGPSFDNAQIERELSRAGARYGRYATEDELLDVVAGQIAAGKVVGHFHGPMEFGPRALGARSILGDPRSTTMQSTMNLKIKFRESFRPFAPAVLREHAAEWFDLPPHEESPYMLLVADVQPDKRLPVAAERARASGIERLKVARSMIPAVTHVDYSARIQTVDKRHGRLHCLLQRFYAKTGCPMLVNTSFNIRGEPIVCSPDDAYRCFLSTDMDVLVVGDFLLTKDEQPRASGHEIDDYLRQFELD
jgi:carbamoyltransferase